ncbi:hypothetical protein [Pantoea sp. App145]|uniref:hypothetical protein n=1 Tax=Pantoea sp. App145 TaxID=3071567 RepID=UPI003A805FE6
MSNIIPPPPPKSQGVGVPVSYGNQSAIALPEVRGLWYNDKDIHLDGWKYISCRFDNCRFYLTTSHFVIDSCFIDQTNIFYFNGESLKAVQLFNRNSEWMRETFPYFAAKKNTDGTISVGV